MPSITAEDLLSSGDTVAVYVTWKGTQDDPRPPLDAPPGNHRRRRPGDDPATIDAPTVATRRRSHPKGTGGGFATRF
jgi:hypothetical protein